MKKQIGQYGATEYYLNSDGSVSELYAYGEGEEKIIYTKTPIKRGYKEFMTLELAEAMERNNLFK